MPVIITKSQLESPRQDDPVVQAFADMFGISYDAALAEIAEYARRQEERGNPE